MQMQFKRTALKPMSPELQRQGEAFIQALLDEGHAYESMKANFYVCLISKALRLSKGNVARAAGIIRIGNRTQIFSFVKSLSLRSTLEQIRREALEEKAS